MLIQAEIVEQDQDVLQLYLCIALGGNSFLHPYIDECYMKNEWEYYEAFQKSGLKGNSLLSMYTTKSEEKIRQMAGILQWSFENQHFLQVDQIIKKGYKFAYQYFRQFRQIDFEDFMRSYAKKQKKKIVKEMDLIYHNIVLWYLSVREGKPFNKRNVAWKSFQDVLLASLNDSSIQEVMFAPSMLIKYKKEIDQLYEEYKIPAHAQYDTIGTFFDYLISIQLKEIQSKFPNLSIELAEKKVFEISPTRYIGAMGGWLKTLQINEMDALNQFPFTKEDLDKVFLELLYVKKYKYISKEDQDLFFISSLYQKCLSLLFRETKQMYLEQSKEDFYLKVKAKETQIKEQERALLKKQKEWQIIYKRQREEAEGLSEELRKANARIRQLEQQIYQMEDYTAEVHALRSLVYREEQEEKAPCLQTMTEVLASMKIVIIGGNVNWQQKVKETLPAAEVFEVDEINRDISKIKRVDAVFINTNVFSHAFYRKILKELSNKETPLFYLNGHSNMEKTILEMYASMNEK